MFTSTSSSPGLSWPERAAGPSGRIERITWRGRFSTSNPAETESPRPESTFSLISSMALNKSKKVTKCENMLKMAFYEG